MKEPKPKDFTNFEINGVPISEFDPFVLSEYLSVYSQRADSMKEKADMLQAKATKMRRWLYNANQACAAYERYKKVERHQNGLIEENRLLRKKLYEFMDRKSVHDYLDDSLSST